MKIVYDNHQMNSVEDLYNYITSKKESLRKYSDIRDFKETVINLDINKNLLNKVDVRKGKVVEAKFKIGYEEHTLQLITKIDM